MMRSPLVYTGAVSLGLHLVIIAALVSSGVPTGHKDSLPAVNYVNLRQLWFPEEQRKEIDLGSPRQSPPDPQQKALKVEPEPSPPAKPKKLTRKLPLPAPTKPPEAEQDLTKPSVLADNSNVTPIETAESPPQERQPQPLSPTSEDGRSEDLLPIKEGSGRALIRQLTLWGQHCLKRHQSLLKLLPLPIPVSRNDTVGKGMFYSWFRSTKQVRF